jgi:hypothetical protein
MPSSSGAAARQAASEQLMWHQSIWLRFSATHAFGWWRTVGGQGIARRWSAAGRRAIGGQRDEVEREDLSYASRLGIPLGRLCVCLAAEVVRVRL